MSVINDVLFQIEAIDLTNETALSEIETLISTKLKSLPAFKDAFAFEAIIRARPLEENQKFHELITNYSYNPDIQKIKVGRANYPNEQIFYASKNRCTAMAEVRFIYANREKEIARYSYGKWDITKPLDLAVVIDISKVKQHQATDLYHISEFIEECQNDYKDDPEIGGFIEIYDYMAQKFATPIQEGEEYKYKITAAFSKFIFNKIPECDGILYQSVQFPKEFNVALKPSVIDSEKIKLTFAARQKYNRVGDNHFVETESINTTLIDYSQGSVMFK
jgi:hypothetical protein